MNRILMLLGTCVCASPLASPATKQMEPGLRRFEVPPAVREGTAFFAERVPPDASTTTFLVEPLQKPEQESSAKGAPFAQSFKVLGSAVSFHETSLSVEFAAPRVAVAGGPHQTDGTFRTRGGGPKGLRVGTRFAVLVTTPTGRQRPILYAAVPVSGLYGDLCG